MAKLGLPKLKVPKKPIVKGIPNNALLGGLLLGGVAVYYYMNQNGMLQGITQQVGYGGEGTGNRITFTVSPQVVQPNSTIQIQGQVLGTNGQPFAVNKIYYYIYRETIDNTTLFYTSGLAGEQASSFTKVIATTNYPAGSYLIAVSDTILTAPPQILPGTSPVGGQNPPVEGQNNLQFPLQNDIGDSITLG